MKIEALRDASALTLKAYACMMKHMHMRCTIILSPCSCLSLSPSLLDFIQTRMPMGHWASRLYDPSTQPRLSCITPRTVGEPRCGRCICNVPHMLGDTWRDLAEMRCDQRRMSRHCQRELLHWSSASERWQAWDLRPHCSSNQTAFRPRLPRLETTARSMASQVWPILGVAACCMRCSWNSIPTGVICQSAKAMTIQDQREQSVSAVEDYPCRQQDAVVIDSITHASCWESN